MSLNCLEKDFSSQNKNWEEFKSKVATLEKNETVDKKIWGVLCLCLLAFQVASQVSFRKTEDRVMAFLEKEIKEETPMVEKKVPNKKVRYFLLSKN